MEVRFCILAQHCNAAGRSKIRQDANQDDENGSGDTAGKSDESGETEENENGSGAEENSPETDSDDGSGAFDGVSDGIEGPGTGSSKQKTVAEEGGRIPFHQTESVSEPVGGEIEYDAEYQREHNDAAASDIERMLEKMAEKAACKQLENERLRELNETAQSISYGDIHSGVDIKVHRISEVDNELKDQYHEIAGPLLTISKQLQRSLVQKLMFLICSMELTTHLAVCFWMLIVKQIFLK